jgi:uncharacterized pyridoxamine 5'-phosphate oxidase family protein
MKDIKEQVLDFLKESKTIVIATASANSEPQIATLYFLADNDFNLYFATGRETKKFKNLHDNKQAAFLIGTGPAVITVQGAGDVKEIETDELKTKGDIGVQILNKAEKEWPVLKLPHEGIAFFRISPNWLTFLNLDKVGHPESYREEYYKII